MAYATIEDLDARIPGGVPTALRTTAEAYLDDASDAVDEATGKTFTGPTDPLLPKMVKILVIRLARRALYNPDGNSFEQLGPQSARKNEEAATAGVLLTKAETNLVRRACGVASAKTVRVPIGVTPEDISFETPIGYGYGSLYHGNGTLP